MKIAVVFLLVAVGSSWANSDYSFRPSHGPTPKTNCMEKVLKTDVKNLLVALRRLICSYEHCKKKECSLDEWTQLLHEVKVTLGDTGCIVDQLVLSGKPTVEEIAKKVGEALQELRDPIRSLLIQLKVEEPVFKLMCGLLEKALLSLEDVLGNLTGELNLGGPTELVNGVLGGILGGLGK